MKTMIAAFATSLALSACVADDDGFDPIEEDDRVDGAELAKTLNSIVGFVGGEAASFVAGELFSLALPEDLATLSAESLEQIRDIVKDENRIAEITTTNGEFNAHITSFNRYGGPDCPKGLTQSGECSTPELNDKKVFARDISEESIRLHEIYVSWVVEDPGSLVSDLSWAVHLAPNVRAGIAIDLSMLRSIFEIDRLKGAGFSKNAEDSWRNLNTAAKDYSELLGKIEGRYTEIKGQFGTVSVVNTGNSTSKVYKGCFEAPEGQVCGKKQATQQCYSNQGGGGCGDKKGASDDEMKAEANALRNDRLTTFESLTLGSEAEFNTLMEHLQSIIDQDYGSCHTVTLSGSPYPDMTNGDYKATGTYNGASIYKKGAYSIYKRASGHAVNNWVLDQDGVDEEWSGTIDYTTNEPATPGTGAWKAGGTARCK